MEPQPQNGAPAAPAPTPKKVGRPTKEATAAAVLRVQSNPDLLASQAEGLGMRPETLLEHVRRAKGPQQAPQAPLPPKTADPAADAMRAAAEAQAARAGAAPPSQQPAAPVEVKYTVQDLVNAMAGMAAGATQALCAFRKIPLQGHHMEYVLWSKDERDALKPAASAAEAEIREFLTSNKYMAIGALVLQIGSTVWAKTEQLKMAVAEEKKQKT